MSFPEIKITPVDSNRPVIDSRDQCEKCGKGRLMKVPVNPEQGTYHSTRLLMRCAVGEIALIGGAVRQILAAPDERSLGELILFGFGAIALAVYAWRVFSGMKGDHIVRCYQCGHEMTLREFKNRSAKE